MQQHNNSIALQLITRRLAELQILDADFLDCIGGKSSSILSLEALKLRRVMIAHTITELQTLQKQIVDSQSSLQKE